MHSYNVLGIFISRAVQYVINEGFEDISDEKIYLAFPRCDFYEVVSGEFYFMNYDIESCFFARSHKCCIKDLYK